MHSIHILQCCILLLVHAFSFKFHPERPSFVPTSKRTTTKSHAILARGGYQLPIEEIQQNLESHVNETDTNSKQDYYYGPCEDVIPAKVETIGYPVLNFTLPDFDEQFRASQGHHLIHVTTHPLLTIQECDDIVSKANAYLSQTNDGDCGEWSSLKSGRFDIAGSWIKDIPPVQQSFNELLRTKLFPMLHRLFPHVVHNVHDLRIQSAYLFKYDTTSGEKTDMHMDSSLLSFTILLNDEEEFEGGGTFYESLGEHGEIVSMQKGCVTFRPAGLRHRGQPITKGVRYIIGGFVTIAGKEGCEHTRQLLTRGTKALSDGDTLKAKSLFEMARDYSPNFSETYMSVAHCLRKFDDSMGALNSYKKAFHANPRNADSAFMVGVMLGEHGDEQAAMRWYKLASELNEYDGDAWYRQGLVYSRQGNTELERKMYEKAITVQPNHADALCNLGCSYGDAGDTDKEIEYYERALEVEPENEDVLNNAKAAYYYQGVGAYQAGDLDKSIASFKRILDQISPGEASVVAAYNAVLETKKKRMELSEKK